MRYVVGRLIEAVPLLIGVSLIAFAISHFAPGDPIALVVDPTMLNEQERAAVRSDLGLDRPAPVQYGKMMWGLVSGDLRSFKTKQPTYTVLGDAFRTTALVGGLGIAVAIVFGLTVGSLAGRRPGGWVDRVLSMLMVLSLASPPFLLGLLLIRYFSEEWRLLPASGLSPQGTVGFHPEPRYLVLPVFVIAFGIGPILARYLRDALVVALADDYVRTARAKGLSERRVIAGHAMRNALIPMLSLLTTFIPITLGGMVIIETVFALPGLGRVTTNAALARDYPVVLTCVMFVAVLTIVTTLVIDLLYSLIDPRIRVR